jgi:hypothetical protein
MSLADLVNHATDKKRFQSIENYMLSPLLRVAILHSNQVEISLYRLRVCLVHSWFDRSQLGGKHPSLYSSYVYLANCPHLKISMGV